jgi:hypothetical protein
VEIKAKMKKFALSIYVGMMGRVGHTDPLTFTNHIVERLEPELPKLVARKPSEQQRQHFGFAPVREDGPVLLHDSGVITLCLQKESKVIPSDTVKQKVEAATREALAKLNADLVEGEEPLTELPSDDARQIKSAIMLQMMKTDNTVRTRCFVQIVATPHMAGIYLVLVHTLANPMREAALFLLRTALESLPVLPAANLMHVDQYPFNTWLASYLDDAVSLVNESAGIYLGESCVLSRDSNTLNVKDIGNVDRTVLRDALISMLVTSVEICTEHWACEVSRLLEIKSLSLDVPTPAEDAEECPDALAMFRADMLLAGHWAVRFVLMLPQLMGYEALIDRYVQQNAQEVEADAAKAEKDKLVTWQIINGNTVKPAEAVDPEEHNPFEDDDYKACVDYVRQVNKVSVSMVQRYRRIGYNKAARLVERMEQEGVVSAPNASGARSVI